MSKNVNSEENLIKKATNIITDAEARTCTFTKTYKVHGHNKTGTFTFKYPSVMDKVQIGAARAKLLDGAPESSIDAYTSNISYMVCYIGKLCIKQPKWFNVSLIEETEIVEDLFMEVTNWVNTFRQDLESGKYDGVGTSEYSETLVGGSETI